ncbi:hypothetical protein ABEB36_014430 [Hypothenemus hampei]|uniref:Uncharacterized protein n=1 Tax=Hypothenemus hampei TaxID=57062 RepID=A0ABD1E3U9_HYPHA
MKECIETEEEYIDLIKTAKSPPFIMVNQNNYQIKNFEREIEKKFTIPKNFQISKAVKIHYYPNGQIDVFTDYDDKFETFFFLTKVTFDSFDAALPTEILGISKEKVKDLQALLPYVSKNGQTYFSNFLKNVSLKNKL